MRKAGWIIFAAALLALVVYWIVNDIHAGARAVCQEADSGRAWSQILGYHYTGSASDCGGPSAAVYVVLALAAVAGLVMALSGKGRTPGASGAGTTTAAQARGEAAAVETRLATYKRMRDAGEISEETYATLRDKVLEEL